ncbi:hypothetical protein B5807_07832 [Epicoccum nigrum]|uniref:Carboxymuconolactone decarboxylase-like domain-containing protein n=1 Tax=Epicoccum nigrum TaxID=105696 RepID=A0A1Y2LZC0_EPING|nr:hypothetical protein B5807_07832 [Epicoccum nigrum]
MIKLLRRLQLCKSNPSRATSPTDTKTDNPKDHTTDSATTILATTLTKHTTPINPLAPPSPPESPPTPTNPSPPRFPSHPHPTAHHTLSLLSSEHTAQRLFGPAFTLRSPATGALLGPFALLAYTDACIPAYCRYIHGLLATPLFTPCERHLIILAAAGVTRVQFVVQRYRQDAGTAGLSDETVERVLSGEAAAQVPRLTARERNVYALARELAGSWGRVRDETWRSVVVQDKPRRRAQEGWLEPEPEPEPEKCEDKDEEEEESPGGGSERLTREEVATLAQVLASALFVSVLVNCAEGGEAVQQP